MTDTQQSTHAAPSTSWYEIVSGSELEQGDILIRCPVIVVPSDATRRNEALSEIRIEYEDVVVLTQSCDLAIRADRRCTAAEIMFCAIYFRDQVKNDSVFGKSQAWESARKGHRFGFHVLNGCQLPGHEFDYVLVDLRRVFTLSTETVREIATSTGERVRLLSPYREALSQAFGMLYMRVGYPIPLPEFR
jgi:hypothetical protein